MLFAQVQKLATPEVAFSTIAPVLIMLGGAIVLLVAGSLLPRRPKVSWHAGLTMLTAAAAIGASIPLWFRARDDGPMLVAADAVRVDGLAIFLGIVIAGGVILTALLSAGYLRRERLEGPEP